jgi:hypothetical protein
MERKKNIHRVEERKEERVRGSLEFSVRQG